MSGVLIINADDWGMDQASTDRALACVQRGAVSSVSAMVLMEDSERAAARAREHGVDCGLHLNLTAAFTGPGVSSRLQEQQRRIRSFLRSHALAPALYHPGLAGCFAAVVQAQLEAFERAYGEPPRRIDGHHHMHLCANVRMQKLLPAGTIVRRNFSFTAGEKNWLNRWYRRRQDAHLTRRYRTADYFFSLPPMDPARLRRICCLAETAAVEMETHPVRDEEYRFLMREETGIRVARGYLLAG